MFKRGKKNGLKGTVTEDQVLSALRSVLDPERKRNLIDLNMIQGLRISDGRVEFSIKLATSDYPLKDILERDSRQAVEAIPGVEQVNITWAVDLPRDARIAGQLGQQIHSAIAVASGKGGVGKSTVAVNFAVSLAESGARVGLLDADIYGPNCHIMLGVDKMPPPQNKKMIPAQAHGIKIMSMGFLVKPGQPLVWRGPMLHSAIRQFLTDVIWGELDFLVVDLPPGTGDAQLSLSQSIPLTGGVIVTLPQEVSLADAMRGLGMFRQLDVPVLGIIENMSYLTLPDGSQLDVFGQGGGRKLADEAGVPFIGEIPMDSDVRIGGDAGTPIVISHPDSAAAKALRQIAVDLSARLAAEARSQQSDFIPIEVIG